MLIQRADIQRVNANGLTEALEAKYARLRDNVRAMQRVIVAYSGGVDSSLVARVAGDVLGRANVLAVLAVSPSLGADEKQEAIALLEHIGVELLLIETHEVEDPRYAENPVNRCYFCKEHLYTGLDEVGRARGFSIIVDGFNADDVGDHRPGRKAGRERGVRSPLHEAGFTKTDIRALARALDLPNWNKPAMACLSSRVEYGTAINPAILHQVDAAERALKNLGFGEMRVRHHDTLARIEVPEDEIALVVARRAEITTVVRAAGYVYVALDLDGLRHGSMNEAVVRRG